MAISYSLEQAFQSAVDLFYANLPQPIPSLDILRNCKIVSHRGEHDNQTVLENTLPAFDTVLEKNVWGIELDIRWTQDLQPVVIHDPDCRRVFDSKIVIHQISLETLKSQLPLIPTLEEIIARYGKKLHLMVELKKEHYPNPAQQSQRLEQLFSPLIPQEDFHFISLTPVMFQFVEFVQNPALLPVAELNFRKLSELALKENYGGVTGHYLFLTNQMVKKHASLQQKIGTGFISSKNGLLRELNRGVEWIFSNHATKIQEICEQLLKHQ